MSPDRPIADIIRDVEEQCDITQEALDEFDHDRLHEWEVIAQARLLCERVYELIDAMEGME